MPGETFEDLIFQLGDVGYERLWNKPNPPRTMDRVVKAAEAYEQRQIELQEVEATMDAEEQAYNEFREACESESAECDVTVQKFKKAVDLAEGKAKSIETKLNTRRRDLAASERSLERLRTQIQQLEEEGLAEKAQPLKAGLKNAKMDQMKRVRECDDMQAEYDKIMNPDLGAGAEGIRARRRQRDLELQLEDRTEAYNQLITELNDQAAQKDEEIRAAKEYFDQALYMLGEELYQLRIADPALSAYYPKLDKLAG